MMKLLIGYDGSECAAVAVADLSRAGLPDQGEAVVLSVADVWPHLESPEMSPDSQVPPVLPAVKAARQLADRELARARELAERAAERVRAELPNWKVTPDAAVPRWTVIAEARADAPHWAIVRKADEWRPDLVVLGSHGRSALGRLLLGSVSQSVLTHAQCSVRIGRGGATRPQKPVRILIGIDGSVGSAAAVSAVWMRNWPPGSEAKIVVAIDAAVSTALPVAAAMQFERAYRDSHEWLRHAVHRTAEELRESGLDAAPLVCEGSPKRVLVEEAERWGADCIFLGAKGMSGIERFLVGSVSAAVAARAHCSVEVVRQPD